MIKLTQIPGWKFSRFSGKRKNKHIGYQSTIEGDSLSIAFTFQDHSLREFQLNLKHKISDLISDTDKFGIPVKYTKSTKLRSDQVRDWEAQREIDFKNGLFRLDGNLISPDPIAIINYYSKRQGKIISNEIDRLSNEQGDPSQISRIKMALAFVQDIPYGVPKEISSIFRSGVISPPEIIYNGYADCDSKCYLFASIINNWISAKDFALAILPGHMTFLLHHSSLSEGKYLSPNGKKYFVVEVAGPGKLNIGESEYINDHKQIKIIPFSNRFFN